MNNLPRRMTYFIFLMVLVLMLLLSQILYKDDDSKETSETISNEALYKGTTIHLLLPSIDEALEKFYEDYLVIIPQEDFYSVEVVNLESITDNAYRIKLLIHPYVGSHNPVGEDELTLIIRPWGEVVLEEFRHLKSYSIPPNLQDIIIKWPPEEGVYEE